MKKVLFLLLISASVPSFASNEWNGFLLAQKIKLFAGKKNNSPYRARTYDMATVTVDNPKVAVVNLFNKGQMSLDFYGEFHFKKTDSDGKETANLQSLARFLSLLSDSSIKRIQTGGSLYVEDACIEISEVFIDLENPKAPKDYIQTRTILGSTLTANLKTIWEGPNQCTIEE